MITHATSEMMQVRPTRQTIDTVELVAVTAVLDSRKVMEAAAVPLPPAAPVAVGPVGLR